MLADFVQLTPPPQPSPIEGEGVGDGISNPSPLMGEGKVGVGAAPGARPLRRLAR
jgi:hypothetical protein